MPELSILMKLKDEITTRIKAIMDLFKEFITHSEELTKTREELAEKERIIEETMAEERAAILECAKAEAMLEIEVMEKVYGKKEEFTDKERALAEIISHERATIIASAEAEAKREMETMEKVYGKREDLTEKERESMEKTAEKRAEVSDEEVEMLEKKTREWKRTFRSITEDQKAFYQKATGYMGDFREMTEEELEKVKELWEENVGRYEEIWDGFTQSVRTSFSALFVDFMDGTKKSQDIWQDFCDSMVKSFKKAVADSLVEKMGLDKLFEGNILNWGNLFTGLGNLIAGVFTGLGKALSSFTTVGTTGFGTLGNVVGVFGKTLSGLIKSGGPLALVLGGMEALTRLVSGKSFIGGFMGGPMESEYSIERRRRFERERAGKEEEWRAQKLKEGFLIGWYGTMYHPETKEAFRWVGPGAQDQEAIEYPTYVAAQGAAFLEGIKLLQGGAVFNKPTFFRAIAGEGGEPEFLSPESLLRKVVREEVQRVPSTYNFGPINVQFPNVTSFQDWLDADPGTIKVIFDRKIYQAMKMSAREGRISKEALLM